MAIVHAYRRTKLHTCQAGGLTLKFAPDTEGRVVCDVPEGPALDRLLELTEGYTLLGQKPQVASEPDEDDDAPLSKYVLTRGDNDETVDLRTLDRAGLLAFIAEQGLDYTPRANAADDTIRDKIVKLLTGA